MTFKFFNRLVDHRDLYDIVKQEWLVVSQSSGFKGAYDRFRSVKKRPKQLHYVEYSKVEDKITSMKDQLSHAQTILVQDSNSLEAQQLEKLSITQYQH